MSSWFGELFSVWSCVLILHVLIIAISYLFFRSDFLTTASGSLGALWGPTCRLLVWGSIKKCFKQMLELQEWWVIHCATLWSEGLYATFLSLGAMPVHVQAYLSLEPSLLSFCHTRLYQMWACLVVMMVILRGHSEIQSPWREAACTEPTRSHTWSNVIPQWYDLEGSVKMALFRTGTTVTQKTNVAFS